MDVLSVCGPRHGKGDGSGVMGCSRGRCGTARPRRGSAHENERERAKKARGITGREAGLSHAGDGDADDLQTPDGLRGDEPIHAGSLRHAREAAGSGYAREVLPSPYDAKNVPPYRAAAARNPAAITYDAHSLPVATVPTPARNVITMTMRPHSARR